jgi:lipopolysaccharide/colanic/teichoic acid biosynthesis glycosyltransferase
MDVFLAASGLILALPICVFAILAILLDDGRPLLYRQERWGKDGEPFMVFKFRTMAYGSDHLRQARRNDERVTRFGNLLRATGLDELPQLLNVLRGEMSIVGPRPLAVGEVVEVEGGSTLTYEDLAGFHARLAVRPGLTSLATVYLAKDDHPMEKFKYDLRYIQRWSLWLDCRLIALSFWISLCGRWELRSSKLRKGSTESSLDVRDDPRHRPVPHRSSQVAKSRA